jgi:excisionase family DNA binding protein
MIEDDELLTIREAADRCKVKHVLLRAVIARKELRIVRLGNKSIRIAPSELRRWWEKKQNQPYVPTRRAKVK